MMNCDVTKGSIYYEVYGEEFPVLILHSTGTDHRSMKAWIEPIFETIQGFQRIYIDLPAHGRSMIDEHVKSTDDILTNILYFIDKTLYDRAFLLLGFSFGGYLAQGILHFRHEQVKGICLLASTLHLKERSLPEKLVFQEDEAVLSTLNPDIRAAFETLMTYQNKENLECFFNEVQPGRLLANKDFLTSNWRTEGYFFSEEPFSNVQSLQQLALIILGKQDAICGYKDHYALVDKFPNSTYAILDGAGHMLPIEKRELVQELVKDWLVRTF